MTEKPKAFKDWFDAEAAARLGHQVAGVWPEFDEAAFCRRALAGAEGKEFHGRVAAFSDALRAGLPESVPEALGVLTASLPAVLPDTEAVTDGWLQWPLGHFIAEHGVPHFEESMGAMLELTRRFSSEFAVRPFLEAYPEETLARLGEWVGHPCAHVRRWCSEGTRPRLPWARRVGWLLKDPGPGLALLEALRDDADAYVRRSVANHLNDVSKDHPERVVGLCRRWMCGASPERRWVVRHGLRTLVKAGHAGALAVLGFGGAEGLEAELEISPAAPRIGGEVTLSAELTNRGDAKVAVVVDYVLHYARPSGRASRKVFKWKTVKLGAGETMRLEKRHPLRHASIRTLYAGEHPVELQVNGQVLASGIFRLRGE